MPASPRFPSGAAPPPGRPSWPKAPDASRCASRCNSRHCLLAVRTFARRLISGVLAQFLHNTLRLLWRQPMRSAHRRRAAALSPKGLQTRGRLGELQSLPARSTQRNRLHWDCRDRKWSATFSKVKLKPPPTTSGWHRPRTCPKSAVQNSFARAPFNSQEDVQRDLGGNGDGL